ncbi:putative dienelactone hydrolase [Deinobacterium chartae]|uniref:Putative dienelactone hydrolase n=1 Tax=Deinobacterium chartae TaxID=521158 RepID=A0A841I4T3_9DEIO|nr:dienelactone hydrolase [Deinobacterium chartae]MBB6099299.1 putative dienelactone hydrolase [Deinobacterium chartae]
MTTSTLAQTAPQLQFGPDFVYGDARLDAPELAARGSYQVGVRTLTVTHTDQLDVLKITDANPNPRYDRKLTLEVWYPAQLAAGQSERTEYHDVLGSGPNDPRRPNTPFRFPGRAARGAQPDTQGGPFPLVIVSHGYPGSRVLMTYLCEHLASRGFVVAAIDHAESTHGDKAGFASTLLNRPLDDLFVLNELARTDGPAAFLAGTLDANRTALVGYSMGGYGALNAAGAGFAPSAAKLPFAPAREALAVRTRGNPAFEASRDPRIKAAVLLAPWGGQAGFWDAEGLAGLQVPSLWIAGDQDDVSDYQGGIRKLFDGAVNSDRYLLLYRGARHNVAPNPAPFEANTHFDDYMHYSEPVWDSTRMNNINQHFVAAFLGKVLRGENTGAYLEVVEKSDDGRWSQNPDGSFGPNHSYWKGFKNRTAVGLELIHRPKR